MTKENRKYKVRVATSVQLYRSLKKIFETIAFSIAKTITLIIELVIEFPLVAIASLREALIRQKYWHRLPPSISMLSRDACGLPFP